MSALTPRVSLPSSRFTQLLYQLPHVLINCCQSYPRPSAESPEVLIYGHTSGLTLLYRSRRAVETLQDEDCSSSNHDFATTHQIYLGTAVLAMSFTPSSLLSPSDQASPTSPARNLLSTSLVLSITCADRTIRLVKLPLTPPKPDAHDVETILSLGAGITGHRFPATSTSLTILPSPDASGAEDLVIASSSSDTLLLWRIPVALSKHRHPVLPKTSSKPLSLKLHSTPISALFNPSPTSVTRRHHLLVTETTGAVRIWDCCTESWQGSFYTPFCRFTSRRKRPLSASWALGGRGILVLLEDGEWGLWDLEASLASENDSPSLFCLGGVVREDGSPLSSSKRRKQEPSGTGGSVYTTVSTTDVSTGRGHECGVATGSVAVMSKPGTVLLREQALRRLGQMSYNTMTVEDEAFAIQYGHAIVYHPSLKKLWKNKDGKQVGESDLVVGRNIGVDKGTAGCVGFVSPGTLSLALSGAIAILEVSEKEAGVGAGEKRDRKVAFE